MTIPDDWVCYATRCFKPYPPGFGLDLLIVGSTIGLIIGIVVVLVGLLITRLRNHHSPGGR